MTTNDYPNWFTTNGASQNFASQLYKFKDVKVDFLQLGAYTGDATKWLFENVLTHPESTLTDVDTWEGSDEEAHKQINWQSVESVYDEKNSQWLAEGRLIKKKMTTDEFFASNDKQFDFVYVDADHTAMAVLKDGIHGYDYLKVNGILAFDDYRWGAHLPVKDRPQAGVDAFRVAHWNKTSLLEANQQVWLKKIS
jgi:predicted O-methyltransferase YrrM